MRRFSPINRMATRAAVLLVFALLPAVGNSAARASNAPPTTSQPPLTISGTVHVGTTPAIDVTIIRHAMDGDAAVSTITDTNGHYTFTNVPQGTYAIAAQPPPGYNPVMSREGISVTRADVTGVDFSLAKPGAVGGLVSDAASGSPIAHATVTISGPNGRTIVRTAHDGSYFAGRLQSGEYVVTLADPAGYHAAGAARYTVHITAAGEVRAGRDFALAADAASAQQSGAAPPTSASAASPPPAPSNSLPTSVSHTPVVASHASTRSAMPLGAQTGAPTNAGPSAVPSGATGTAAAALAAEQVAATSRQPDSAASNGLAGTGAPAMLIWPALGFVVLGAACLALGRRRHSDDAGGTQRH